MRQRQERIAAAFTLYSAALPGCLSAVHDILKANFGIPMLLFCGIETRTTTTTQVTIGGISYGFWGERMSLIGPMFGFLAELVSLIGPMFGFLTAGNAGNQDALRHVVTITANNGLPTSNALAQFQI